MLRTASLTPALLLLTSLIPPTLCLVPSARATPFTLSARRLAADISITLDQADSQWDAAGRYGVFSLGGRFSSQLAQINLRYGITDGLEIQAHAAYKNAVYQAAPFHLFPAAAIAAPAAALTDATINISGQESGVSDVYLGLSYRPYARRVHLALEGEVKIPTGYRPPSGTFCANLTPAQTAAAVAATLRDPGNPAVRPIDFCTGATLGDGQVDLLLLGQLGAYIQQTRTFVRLDAGMNLRFQGPGQQVVAGLKVGEDILDLLVLYAGARLAYTVNEGEAVGTTINTRSPTAPARDYPGELLLFDPALRDRSYLFFDAGVVVRLTRVIELRASYARVLWGNNFPELSSISLGTSFLIL